MRSHKSQLSQKSNFKVGEVPVIQQSNSVVQISIDPDHAQDKQTDYLSVANEDKKSKLEEASDFYANDELVTSTDKQR